MNRIRKAAEMAHRRREGSQEAENRIQQSFAQADDLHSECRHCHHIRRGTMDQVTGRCPNCGAE